MTYVRLRRHGVYSRVLRIGFRPVSTCFRKGSPGENRRFSGSAIRVSPPAHRVQIGHQSRNAHSALSTVSLWEAISHSPEALKRTRCSRRFRLFGRPQCTRSTAGKILHQSNYVWTCSLSAYVPGLQEPPFFVRRRSIRSGTPTTSAQPPPEKIRRHKARMHDSEQREGDKGKNKQ